MVRVFSAYQFVGQNILRVNGDVRAASVIDSKHLILAKCNHVIEIATLQSVDANNETGNEIRKLFAFPTVDEVIQMTYCKFGKSTATRRETERNSKRANVSPQEITLQQLNENREYPAIRRFAAST